MISEEKAKENMEFYKAEWKRFIKKSIKGDHSGSLLAAREALGAYQAYKEVLEIKDKEEE